MAGANTNIFSQTKTLNDYTQEDAQAWFKQQLLAAQVGKLATAAANGGASQLPAPLQLANAVQGLEAKGDPKSLAQAQLIRDFAKADPKGFLSTPGGGLDPKPGFVAGNAAVKGGEADAKNQSDATYKPIITAGDEAAKKQADLTAKLPVDQGLLGTALQSIQEQQNRISGLGIAQNPDGTYNVPDGLARNFGLVGALPNRPGSESANAAESLKQINANSFIQALGSMKAQSATGASGLGALSEKEGDKVQSAAAALGKSQDAQSFAKNLKIYNDALTESQARLQSNFNLVHPGILKGSPVIQNGAVVAPSAIPDQATALSIARQRGLIK